MKRFSALALASVAAVGITGIYAASLRLGPAATLGQTSYGQAMLVKQVFVGLLMVAAAINLLWLSPEVQEAAEAGSSAAPILGRFRKSVSAEIGLGALLLLSISVLTYLPPPKPALPFEIRQTNTARDLRMTLDIVPGTLGNNSFTVHLTTDGNPVDQVDTALLRFNSLSHDVPQFDGPLEAKGNGDYTAEGNYLSLTGKWQVLVVVRRQDKFDAIAYFHFTLPTAQDEAAKANRQTLATVLLALDGLLATLALRAATIGSRETLPG